MMTSSSPSSTPGFTSSLCSSAKNRFLTDALEQVRGQLYVIMPLLPDTPMWQQRSLTEHQRIFIAVQQGDAEKASQAVARHVRLTLASARALLHSLRTGNAHRPP